MKRFMLAVFALLVMVVPVNAQQLNVGVSQRKFAKNVVADAVLMAPQVGNFIFYGQTTFKNVRPELYLAAEVPVIDLKSVYLGFDNGFGWSAVDKKYGNGSFFTGLTSWVTLYKTYGAYGMYSFTPDGKSSTLQIGAFKRIF